MLQRPIRLPKLKDHLSVLPSYTDPLPCSNHAEKKQHSSRYEELHKKRSPSITRGLVTAINTIREKRNARVAGKQRHLTILRTLHTGPKMIRAVKSEIILTYLETWEQNTNHLYTRNNQCGISHHLHTPCAKSLYYCNTDLSKETLYCDCDKISSNAEVLSKNHMRWHLTWHIHMC